jgi:Ca-activated chloride channel family protein
MIRLGNPVYLFFLLLIPVILIWRNYLKKRGDRHIFYSSKSILGSVKTSLKIELIKILPLFKFLAFFLFVIALSRPQLLDYYELEKKKGIDILIALDISGSMASIDYKPKNRLELAKEVIGDFIVKRTSDRLGLVTFAGNAFTKCPLTIDYEMLKYTLSDTRIGEIEDGTAIGMALANSVNRIRVSKLKTKVIILLTDGVNNKGEIAPLDAAEIARDFNIKVYTIGVGRKGKADFPITDRYGNQRMLKVDVKIDEELLKKIAGKTGGLYFRAADQGSLSKIFSEIDKWEKTEISKRKLSNKKDIYQYFLITGLFFLLFVEVGKRSLLRVLP